MRTSILVSSLALSLISILPAATAHAEDAPPVVPAAAAAIAEGDVVELSDGRRLTGVIVGEDERFVSLRSGGVLRAYPRSSVVSIVRAERIEAPLPPPTEAARSTQDARKQAKKEKKDKRGGRADADLSPDARSWLLGLLARAQSPESADPAVRKSLAAAIQALGPAALVDVLRAAADAADGERDLLEQIAANLAMKSSKRAGGKRTEGKRGDEAPMPAPGAEGAAADPEQPTGDGRASAAESAPKPTKTAREKLMDLGLTPDQGLEMRDVLETFGAAARDIYLSVRDGSLPRADARAEVADLRSATLASLRQLLDPTQLVEFEKFADELLDPRKAGRGAKKGKNQSGKAAE